MGKQLGFPHPSIPHNNKPVYFIRISNLAQLALFHITSSVLHSACSNQEAIVFALYLNSIFKHLY